MLRSFAVWFDWDGVYATPNAPEDTEGFVQGVYYVVVVARSAEDAVYHVETGQFLRPGEAG